MLSDEKFTVPVSFSEGVGHEFKYPAGESVTFNHIREGEEEMECITLKHGDKIENPLVLRAALMSMDKDELANWVYYNTCGKWYN